MLEEGLVSVRLTTLGPHTEIELKGLQTWTSGWRRSHSSTAKDHCQFNALLSARGLKVRQKGFHELKVRGFSPRQIEARSKMR
jgi:hypothetical protein